jgi:hypothetical protein
MVRRLCAPREVVVERVFKREDTGVDVILFASCEPAQPSSTRRSRSLTTHGVATAGGVGGVGGAGASGRSVASSQGWLLGGWWGSSTSRAGGTSGAGLPGSTSERVRHGQGQVSGDGRVARVGAGSGSSRSWGEWARSWSPTWHWYQPVRASVRGGYTISPREDCSGGNSHSPECLVTCILKVKWEQEVITCLCRACWMVLLHELSRVKTCRLMIEMSKCIMVACSGICCANLGKQLVMPASRCLKSDRGQIIYGPGASKQLLSIP